MGVAEDIARIVEQERALQFDAFDENTAFSIGARVRERVLSEKLAIVVDIRTWDRPLFYAAFPGSTGSNPEWTRRKINVVRMFLVSTYRMVLEQQRPDRTFKPGAGLDAKDYVLAGGGFPIAVKGAGVIGAIAVSGLHERDDHAIAAAALAAELGLDPALLSLPPPA